MPTEQLFPKGTGGGSSDWGDIGGTLSDQTDLQTALDDAEQNAKDYADALVVGLIDDRGNYNASGNVFPSSGGSGTAGAILKGDLWTISVAGTLGGHVVTAGDLIRALIDTPGSTDANWAITENNLGYVAESSANKDTDSTFAANSDTKYPSQKAVKTAIDAKQTSLVRTTVNVVTGSLADLAEATGTVVLGKTAIVSKVVADRECRIRLYPTSALRTADSARALGTAVADGDNEPLLEVVPIVGDLSLWTFDTPTVYNGDGSPSTSIYYAIQNRSGATSTVQVDFTVLVLES